MPEIEISERLLFLLYFLPLFFISITIHEYAHAFTAYKFGDDTAFKQGRLTLNPIKHIDLFGSIIMPILAFSSGFMLIGWAKPVPVDRRKLKNPYKDDAVVSFAGPASNFLFAVLAYLIFLTLFNGLNYSSGALFSIFWMTIFFNIFLFCFNLLPIPPLDGSHILFDLIPNKLTAKYLSFSSYGTIILLIFIYSPLWPYFITMVNWISNFFKIP